MMLIFGSKEGIFLKKRWVFIFAFIGILLSIKLLNRDRGDRSWIGDICWEGSPYTYSEGVLSTGIIYEFRGEFNFTEFRRQCHYYLEREADGTFIAETPMEVAELGQFHFDFIRRDVIVLVYYCPDTDNWIIERKYPEGIMFLGLQPDTIFAINRSTGIIVEFSRFTGDGFLGEWLKGWRRTLR